MPIIIIIALVIYIIDVIMKPEKHMVGLIILAILYAIFGSFYDSTGARDDQRRKSRG